MVGKLAVNEKATDPRAQSGTGWQLLPYPVRTSPMEGYFPSGNDESKLATDPTYLLD